MKGRNQQKLEGNSVKRRFSLKVFLHIYMLRRHREVEAAGKKRDK
jgi:hypothetical protein